ncbi:Fc.00g012930.m01.CDS01 [Cosmosporella sp. VM-42]
MKFAIVALTLSALAHASPIETSKRLLFGKHAKESVPFTFTSTFKVTATPDQVVNPNNEFTGGLEGAKGIFQYGLNSKEDVICYNITITGFRGEFSSLASTATHIHEAAKGKSGPPRIAFPNPEGDEKRRNTIGCLKGPFKTGVIVEGKDTGTGFKVKQIEDNPAVFFTDVHSSLAVPGAVRGQLDSGKC